MTTKVISGVEITLGFFPLAFFLFFCTPVVEIDGVPQRRRWGTHFFELPPGPHSIKIYFRYLTKARCGENGVIIDLVPDAIKHIRFYMPPWMMAKGKLTVSD